MLVAFLAPMVELARNGSQVLFVLPFCTDRSVAPFGEIYEILNVSPPAR
jgi:hypothetical protein